MGNKSWRITSEQEFYQKANVYITKHAKRFYEVLEERFKNNPIKLDELQSKHYDFVTLPNHMVKDRVLFGLDFVLNDIDDWKEFSGGVNSSLDDIMLRLLISNIFRVDYVCSLFVTSNTKLTEEFIEDYIYASSYLFKFDEWDDTHVNAVTSCAASGLNSNQCKELLELYDKSRLRDKPINIKLDLSDITLYDKSPEFINKYFINVKGRLLPKNSKEASYL